MGLASLRTSSSFFHRLVTYPSSPSSLNYSLLLYSSHHATVAFELPLGDRSCCLQQTLASACERRSDIDDE